MCIGTDIAPSACSNNSSDIDFEIHDELIHYNKVIHCELYPVPIELYGREGAKAIEKTLARPLFIDTSVINERECRRR